MQMGFRIGQSRHCLVEKPSQKSKSNRLIDRYNKDDSEMIPITGMTACDFRNGKVRQFMESKEELLKKRIERHNLQNLNIGGKEY